MLDLADVMPAEMEGVIAAGSPWSSSPFRRFWRVSQSENGDARFEPLSVRRRSIHTTVNAELVM